MSTPPPFIIDRRTFLADLGRGTVALAILGTVGCNPSTLASAVPTTGGSTAAGPSPSPAGSHGGAPTSTAAPAGTAPAGTPPSGPVTWERVTLGFVSAYVLVRGGEAALVDTGGAGSGGAILKSLQGIGLGWDAVAHVIVTHKHNDHQGSLREVMQAATAATAYAGAEDIPVIASPRPLTTVGDGDEVFGLRIVRTPGHTPGSISVLDPLGGILVAGDALGTADGRPTLPGAQFTADMEEAKRSIVKLGGFAFETLLVGHGDPIESGADALVVQLGAS